MRFNQLKRRDFILLAGGTATWPLVARAQQVQAGKCVAILIDAGEADAGRRLAVFRQGLEETGWLEGRNIQSTIRLGEGQAERVRAYAAELVKTNPALILAVGGTGLTALLGETRTIPIVFVSAGDPVAAGQVASMAHPGGNATGFTAFEGGIGTKWVELIRELAPAIKRLLVLSSGNPSSELMLPAIERAAGLFSLETTVATVQAPADVVRAIEMAAGEPKAGMIAVTGSFMTVHRDLIATLAARHRVPSIYPDGSFVAAGGLISYGIEQVELYRQAGRYAGRILRGEKPGDLPVQAATKFELIINRKAATALGLTVPPNLLATADQVVE
jgi:putative tryptophan/tyrosine transport system substrate-binding protein